jgi:hypothetical protein
MEPLDENSRVDTAQEIPIRDSDGSVFDAMGNVQAFLSRNENTDALSRKTFPRHARESAKDRVVMAIMAVPVPPADAGKQSGLPFMSKVPSSHDTGLVVARAPLDSCHTEAEQVPLDDGMEIVQNIKRSSIARGEDGSDPSRSRGTAFSDPLDSTRSTCDTVRDTSGTYEMLEKSSKGSVDVSQHSLTDHSCHYPDATMSDCDAELEDTLGEAMNIEPPRRSPQKRLDINGTSPRSPSLVVHTIGGAIPQFSLSAMTANVQQLSGRGLIAAKPLNLANAIGPSANLSSAKNGASTEGVGAAVYEPQASHKLQSWQPDGFPLTPNTMVANPYIQALRAHREELLQNEVDFQAMCVDSLAARLATQRQDGLSTLKTLHREEPWYSSGLICSPEIHRCGPEPCGEMEGFADLELNEVLFEQQECLPARLAGAASFQDHSPRKDGQNVSPFQPVSLRNGIDIDLHEFAEPPGRQLIREVTV